MSQFALPLPWHTDSKDDEFLVTPSGERAVRMLQDCANWPVRAALLAGPPASGRSLLGRIFMSRFDGDVIDDAGQRPERELFHAWNWAQESERPLLLIASALPPEWRIRLPDLRSRLSITPSATIDPPDDALMAALFDHAFVRRHLDARPELIAWLVARVERRHAAVIDAVDRLDRAALAGHRRLSIPLARATLRASATFTDRSDSE